MDSLPTPPPNGTPAGDGAPHDAASRGGSSSGARPEDVALARFVRTGDADAFGALYDELAPSLLRLAAKLLRDPAAAEDALQATFLAALTAAARWDGRPVRPWMTGILANVVRNQRRSAARAPDLARLPTRPAPSDPLDDAARAELDRAVDASVRALPDAWQQPVLLRVREGLSAEQIAKLLDRPAGTIRSQLARGLERLRRGLAGAFALLGGASGRREAATRAPGGVRAGRHAAQAHRTMSHAALPPGAGALAPGGLVMFKALGALLGVGTLGVLAWFAWPATQDGGVALVETPRAAQFAMALDPQTPRDVEALEPPAIAAPAAAPSREESPVAAPVAAAVKDDDVLGPFRVLVLDGDDRPVADASVEVFAGGATPGAQQGQFLRSPPRITSEAQPISTRVTDDSGRCDVVLRGSEVLAARHEALGRSRLFGRDALRYDVTVGAGEAVLVLEAPCRVTGRVLDARGVPATGATLRIWTNTSGGRGTERAVDDLVADSDGAFEVLVDPPNGWNLEARVGDRRSPVWHFDARPGATVELQLVVPDPWTIEGTLVDADGTPRAGGRVCVWQDGEDLDLAPEPSITPWSKERSTLADDDGAFRFELPLLGTWHLLGLPDADTGSACKLTLQPPRATDAIAFEPASASSDVLDVELSADAPLRRVTLALRRAAPVRGTVVDGEGRPLAGHVVSARPSGATPSPFGGPLGPDENERFGLARALTGTDGAFLLDGLHPDGRFDLSVYAGESSRFVVAHAEQVAAGTDGVVLAVRDDARRPAFVEGRVIDAASGEPVPHFRVELGHEVAPNVFSSTDASFDDPDGRFRIDELVPGRSYSLRVTATTGRNVPDLPFDVAEDRDDLAPLALGVFEASLEGHKVVAALPRPSRLEVELFDALGAPLPHVSVGIRQQTEVVESHFWNPVRTDDEGRATFPRLWPGTYRVSAEVAGERIESTVDVPGAGTARVSLRP
ncbi:MAG: sigma-70 family RNA polymerase sigma factor [Planctomycetes bacterium]|nr:sigma-70 family RNA polymerase sigma factor [Planctomycetota bacterium]